MYSRLCNLELCFLEMVVGATENYKRKDQMTFCFTNISVCWQCLWRRVRLEAKKCVRKIWQKSQGQIMTVSARAVATHCAWHLCQGQMPETKQPQKVAGKAEPETRAALGRSLPTLSRRFQGTWIS